jgi:hypothetical protein
MAAENVSKNPEININRNPLQAFIESVRNQEVKSRALRLDLYKNLADGMLETRDIALTVSNNLKNLREGQMRVRQEAGQEAQVKYADIAEEALIRSILYGSVLLLDNPDRRLSMIPINPTKLLENTPNSPDALDVCTIFSPKDKEVLPYVCLKKNRDLPGSAPGSSTILRTASSNQSNGISLQEPATKMLDLYRTYNDIRNSPDNLFSRLIKPFNGSSIIMLNHEIGQQTSASMDAFVKEVMPRVELYLPSGKEAGEILASNMSDKRSDFYVPAMVANMQELVRQITSITR